MAIYLISDKGEKFYLNTAGINADVAYKSDKCTEFVISEVFAEMFR